MEKKLTSLRWLEKQKNKDLDELQYEKSQLIKSLKKTSKDEIFKKNKSKKQSIWQRLMKLLLG